MGFTLIELITSIAIISIVISASVFAIADVLPDYNLQKAANCLYLDFQLAKSTAVLHQEQVEISFSPEQNTYVVRSLTNKEFSENSENEAGRVIKKVALDSYGHGIVYGRGINPPCQGCSSEIISYRENKIRFNMNGSTNANGYVYLTHKKGELCYRIGTPSMAGAITMDKARNGKWEIR